MANKNQVTLDQEGTNVENQTSELAFGRDSVSSYQIQSEEKLKLEKEKESLEKEKQEFEKQKADFEKQRLDAIAQAEKQANDLKAKEPEKEIVAKRYDDLLHSDLVVIEFDHESTVVNKKNGGFEVVKESVKKVLPKSYWDSLDKDSKGYPIHVNASLEGIAVLNEKSELVETLEFL
ncbi:hypothetical protein SAMN04515674_105314 [Pseudarcicella hirudinis]|uniref:Uncharacterized protein n=1 Tax=Pseudarcicella hirudinis TaxID=1079859 RepID=A0A1I5T0T8_9BACT|nr:hypothetical protein [Pseudarcicella hirudinis]SFP76650.1 hypothetical protein SAMN04515674_105314 [Pseudarcicella hirudinis]